MLNNFRIYFLLLSIIGLLSCGSKSPSKNINNSSLEIIYISPQETDAAIVISNIENEKIVILAEKDSNGEVIKITGGTYFSSESSFTFWFGDNGLPSMAISEDFVFTFSNYTNNTVDVSVKAPDGTINYLLKLKSMKKN